MNRPDIKPRQMRLSPRALVLLGMVALMAAGAFFAWRYLNHPPRPWLVRWKLDRYLKKQAHAGNFKVDFPFPSKADMAKPAGAGETPGPVRGSRTGKDFDTLRSEYLTLKIEALRLEQAIVRNETRRGAVTNEAAGAAPVPGAVSARRKEWQDKEQRLSPILDDLWEFQRHWVTENSTPADSDPLAKARADFARDIEQRLQGAGSYEAMYLAIGQELFVACGLLESRNAAHRRLGVTTAFLAARHALDNAINGNVAARICEGYLLPNLDLATDTSPRSAFNHENFLRQCADLFRRNNEFNNVARTYALYLAGTTNAARADWARSQIATAYEDGGMPREAIMAIREIRDTNAYSRLIRRIPRLEQDAGLMR